MLLCAHEGLTDACTRVQNGDGRWPVTWKWVKCPPAKPRVKLQGSHSRHALLFVTAVGGSIALPATLTASFATLGLTESMTSVLLFFSIHSPPLLC